MEKVCREGQPRDSRGMAILFTSQASPGELEVIGMAPVLEFLCKNLTWTAGKEELIHLL